MPVFDNPHSRLVFWLKIVLPLAALAILSTIFLFSRATGPEELIPFSEADVEVLARAKRLGQAENSGMTSDGASLTIRAARARPGIGTGVATAEDLSATYARDSGFRADLTAREGRVDDASGELTLTGAVHIVTSTGFLVDTERLIAALNRTRMTAPQDVAAEAPFGKIDAGSMTLDRTGPEGTEVLVFNKGVRLLYQP